MLDQSAMFDTIDHSTLIQCLSSWVGVGGVTLEWFKSYHCDLLSVHQAWLCFIQCQKATVWYYYMEGYSHINYGPTNYGHTPNIVTYIMVPQIMVTHQI